MPRRNKRGRGREQHSKRHKREHRLIERNLARYMRHRGVVVVLVGYLNR
jgi:hypothetical protein